MATFGLIVPGRAVETGFQLVENNKFLVTIPNAEAINHVVVFMTGISQLPSGTACSIFFSLPDPNAPPTWHYLGHLTNDKPSAIYKLSNLTKTKLENAANGFQASGFNYIQSAIVHVAQIGISVEPIESILQMVPAIDTVASNATLFSDFINKTVGNLYNYCSSFSRSAGDLAKLNPFQSSTVNNDTQYVPLSTLQTWYENYTRRLSNDQNFWKTLN